MYSIFNLFLKYVYVKMEYAIMKTFREHNETKS